MVKSSNKHTTKPCEELEAVIAVSMFLRFFLKVLCCLTNRVQRGCDTLYRIDNSLFNVLFFFLATSSKNYPGAIEDRDSLLYQLPYFFSCTAATHISQLPLNTSLGTGRSSITSCYK